MRTQKASATTENITTVLIQTYSTLRMIRVNTQRSKNKSPAVFPFVLLMALSLALQKFVALHNIIIITERELLQQDEFQNGVKTNLGPTFGKRHICPRALSLLHRNTSVIQSAYEAAEAFHNGGGNLKAIEIYLNSHMDETLERLKLKFYPSGSSEPISDQDRPRFNDKNDYRYATENGCSKAWRI
jgi:hypothetical protein